LSRPKLALLVLLALSLFAVPTVANAATLAVDDDGAQCPAAQFATIQAAVDAAAPGDTVAVCPGVYVEGTGAVGTDALTIEKSLTIKGAGADLVSIEPARSTPTGGQIAETPMDIRDKKGDIVLAAGAPTAPINVSISGVTVDGNGVFAKAGIVYLDAEGALVRDRVRGIATSITNTAYELPGGYRNGEYGYGIAQVTAASGVTGAAPRPLLIDHTRVEEYNKLGILIDGGTGSALPVVPSGVVNAGTLEADQVVGRVECLPFNTPLPPPYVLGGTGATPTNELPGNCTTVGLTTTGPTFGQDGVRVAGGATVAINDSTISQNLVNGETAPAYGVETNNANLAMGAGVRLLGAGASTVSHSNVTDNAYGVLNLNAAGDAAATANPVEALNDWWGLAVKATSNVGPAISPTINPAYQENPVNGTAGPEGSDAVHFLPFRNGSESDPDAGEWPVIYAPLPVDDAPPTISLATDKHDYDRGETVQLTATAADDFGVTSITFYDGNTELATVTPPADTATLTIPADAACGSTATLSAVATDFLGQTGSGSSEIAVAGTGACGKEEEKGHEEEKGKEEGPKGSGGSPPPPPPPAPGAPTVKLSAPGQIGASGATVSATATADTAAGASVAKVEFFLGNELLCTDTAAPYKCKVLPTGAEVGKQALRAVVTDSAKQTATAEQKVTIAKFAPTAMPIKATVGKAAKGKVARLLSGSLKLPARVTAAEACTSGSVTVSVERGGKTVLPPTQVSLHRDCTWKLRFTAVSGSNSKFLATAKFGGNAVLKPASTGRRFH
jgi:Bacterial Ig domain